MKVPYMLILGKREAEAGQVSVRLRSGESMNGIPYEEFESKIISNIKERKLEIAL
jgi:threonyl-tRNA synthetase